MSKRIALLLGGLSPEREVSLVSGRECAKGLRAKGHEVHEIDPANERWIDDIKALKPDLVFNALHGLWGEDGRVQGVLEYLRIPYTHSGVLASALAMDKQKTKAVLRLAGLNCPDGKIVSRFDAARDHVMPAPYVAKPNDQGSSVGVLIVREGANRPPAELAADSWPYGDEILIEKFIPGRELTVAVMGDRALTVTEIVPKTAFYDYEAKYADGGSTHQLPAGIPAHVFDQAMEAAVTAHRELGCRGLTRSDFRWDEGGDGKLWLLEINTQPGMTPTSLAPEQAAHCGIGFPDLVEWIAEDASCQR
ncbi:D-alanine--D-alanine ligase [Glycocaulis alkaliphilus]|uniref:D-alanine--D-alanine ligase n=1 Tax=Glycocaulis alkaliphilus TaxID=1434191 RepID=A0A3T0E7G5_9PROT|nr:D-alanine--D-alanine ligase [Glycocaulis alkaliphilus]AZU03214.1 D-alanine--D-alanine ligase [Glycocaulis alkaliphilus]GGB71839.1 D-alanine--D-alanine ligase [Glycocaulis alkaliphilus]